MSRLYPADTKPRTGYQHAPRTPGPLLPMDEPPIRWWIIAAPVAAVLAWLLVAGWLA